MINLIRSSSTPPQHVTRRKTLKASNPNFFFFKFNNFILRWYCTIAEANKNQLLITIKKTLEYLKVSVKVEELGEVERSLHKAIHITPIGSGFVEHNKRPL